MDNPTAKKNNRLISYVQSSFLVRCLVRFTDFLYSGMKNSAVGTWLCGANEPGDGETKHRGVLGRLFGRFELKKKLIIPAKQKLNEGVAKSRILSFVRNFMSGLLQLHMKFYGVLLFSFGLFTAVTAIAVKYGLNADDASLFNVYVGAASIVFSLPAIFSSKQLCDSVKSSGIMKVLLGYFAGFRIDKLEGYGDTKGRTNIAFILGMLLGAATYFVNPLYILFGAFGAVCAYLVLCQPETGVVGIFLLLPFIPTMAVAALIIYVVLCYSFKLMQGRRILRFNEIDITVLAFLAVVLFGGIVSVSPGETLKPALMYVCLAMGYFLVVNLVRTLEWVYRCIAASLVAVFIVSMFGIYEYYFGDLQMKWLDTSMFSDIEGRVVSTFDNPNVLAEYLIMLLPFALALLLISKKAWPRIGSAVLLAVIAACVVFTWSRGAWLGIMIGLAVLLLIYSKKVMSFFIVCLLGVPFLPFVLPSSISSRLFSIGNLADTSTSYRVSIWKGTLKMLSDYWFSGIGVSPDAFSKIYPDYSLPGIEAAPHSHNLYLQIWTETGILGLLIFLVFVFLLLRSCFTFYSHKNYERTPMKLMSMACMSGIIAVLAQGMTDHIWYNYRVFAAFWLMAGLLCAIHRSTYSDYPVLKTPEISMDLKYR